MTTSGTYAYNPSLGEMTLYAFNLCGVRSTSILQEHMTSARTATNLMLSQWANRGVNLWKVDLVTVPFVTGQSTYDVEAKTVMILDAYVTTTSSGQRLYGELTMIITVNTDGRVLATEVVQSSGLADLDRRAQAIATASGPFGEFTEEMRKQADQLAVVSRFIFSRDNTLQTKGGEAR